MSKENHEIDAINNIYERSVEEYKQIMGIDDDRDISEFDLELMYKVAEKAYYEMGA